MKVVLEAFGGKLRSQPMDWPENIGPRIVLALDMDGERFWDANGRQVIDQPSRPAVGEFIDTGRYSAFGDAGGRVYTLVSVR